MTPLNIRTNLKKAAHLTASGLIKAGDAVGNMQVPNTTSIGVGIKNIRRNIATTINPDN